MKNFIIRKSDLFLVESYLKDNSDKPIFLVYREIKEKKLKDRTKVENIIFTYLSLNKRRYGLK